MKSLAPGSYRLAAERAGGRVFASAAGPEVVLDAGVQQAGPLLREVPAVSLFGQVLDGNGRPVAEANIVVAIQGHPGAPLAFGSDGEGRFAAAGFQGADQVEIWALRFGLESARFGPVTIGPSGLQDILLRLPAP